MASFPFVLRGFSGFEAGDAYEFFGQGTGTYSFVTSPVRDPGLYALRINPVTTGTGWVAVRPPDISTPNLDGSMANPSGYFAFYFRVATFPATAKEIMARIISVGGNTVATWFLRSDGYIEIYDRTSPTPVLMCTSATTLQADTWYRLDAYLNAGAGTSFTLKIDGAVDASGSGLVGGIGNLGGIQLGKVANTNGQTVDFFYDDCVLTTSDWMSADDYWVERAGPVSTNAADAWTANGAATHHECLDDLPGNDGDSTYVLGGNGGDLLLVPSSGSYGDAIYGVKLAFVARQAGSSIGTAAVSNSVYDYSSTVGLPGSGLYIGKGRVWRDDFGRSSIDWTEDNVNALVFGARDPTAGSGPRMTSCALHVIHGPIAQYRLAYNFGG